MTHTLGGHFGRLWNRAVARQPKPEPFKMPEGSTLKSIPQNTDLDPSFRTELGAVYRHKMTGFAGIAVAKIQYLTGCDQTGLRPRELKDGVPQELQWFDDMSLEPVEGSRFRVVDKEGETVSRVRTGSDVAPPSGRTVR